MVTPYKNKFAKNSYSSLEQSKISTSIDSSPKSNESYVSQFIINMNNALQEMTLDDEEVTYVDCVVPKETNYYIPPLIRHNLGDKEILNSISDLSI